MKVINIGIGSEISDKAILGVLSPYYKGEERIVIGHSSIIRSGSVIYYGVKIGDTFKGGHNILIRENVVIGYEGLVGTNSVIDSECVIGNEVKIQSCVYIPTYTTIEDNVFVGPGCVMTNDKFMDYSKRHLIKGPTIKTGAKIGANVTILPGLVIGKNSVIGAGSVVTKDVPDDVVVYGNPARVRK